MENLAAYEPAIAIIIGVFLCFFGYRVKKIAFTVVWFIIGFYLMSLVAPHITSDQTWQTLLPIIAGLAMSLLGFTIERFCIFAAATYAVSTTIIETFQMTEFLPIIFAIAAGVVVGCIAVSFIKPLGIITTSLSGAKLLAKYIISIANLSHEPYFYAILIGCFALGVLFQYRTCRHIE
jgi:hypothetical protein